MLSGVRRENMKTAFLYAGQGSQKAGMGSSLYETFPVFKETVDKLDGVLPFSAWKLMQEGPEDKLMQTEYTQPCMAIFAAALTAVLKDKGIAPDAACGLSLGEYGALYAAGVMDAESYVKTVAYRGQVMAEAAEGLETSMSAVLGLSAEQTEAACEAVMSGVAVKESAAANVSTTGETAVAENGTITGTAAGSFVTIANYNCPGQYVICGDEAAVTAAEAKAAELGAKRCIRLKVSAPFHTKLLVPAGVKLYDYLQNVTFSAPEIPVAMNMTGRLLDSSTVNEDAGIAKDSIKGGMDAGTLSDNDADAERINGTDSKETEDGMTAGNMSELPQNDITAYIKELLREQVSHSVRFEEDVKALLDAGVDTFIEIGPGNTLSGFVKKTAAACGVKPKIYTLQEAADVEKLLEGIRNE